MDETIAGKVRSIVQEVRPEIDFSQLPVSADFDDAGLDSLDHASILFSVQETYSIVIPDDVVDVLKSIEAIAAFIQSHDVGRH